MNEDDVFSIDISDADKENVSLSIAHKDSLHHIEMEQALLSLLLHDNSLLESLPDGFFPEVFYDPLHQKIFRTLISFVQKGYVANPLTLAQFFKNADEKRKELDYLAEISTLLLPYGNIREYAQHIYELYLRRQLIHIGRDFITDVHNVDVDAPNAAQHIEHLEHQLFSLVQWGNERGPQAFSVALDSAISLAESAYGRDGHVVGVSTGLRDLDKLLGGLHPSDLLILAARPSMGKSALATNIAFSAAKMYMNSKNKEKKNQEGAVVAFFSLEMSANQLAMRLLGQETGISSDRIRRGAIDQGAFQSFIQLSRELSTLPLFIDDTPSLSVASLLTRARRLKRKHGIGLIVVDYLQLLSTGRRSSVENRVQELSEITRGLKMLAKELDVPVLALSQLSRAVEQREDKRPQLADLRESGTIEQDADVVMFIYREEYYESRKKPTEGSEKMAAWQKNMSEVYNVAEVIVAKQRHGPIANVRLHFDAHRTKFSDLHEV